MKERYGLILVFVIGYLVYWFGHLNLYLSNPFNTGFDFCIVLFGFFLVAVGSGLLIYISNTKN